MNLLTKDMMPELLSVNEGTCISLYMPTHRTHPDNLKIRYSLKTCKNLKQSLLQNIQSPRLQHY
jgi:hypothetical protein